jgi:hypothetical protein
MPFSSAINCRIGIYLNKYPNCFIFSVKEFSSKKQSGRSNRIGVNFVKWAIQTLWERSGSSSSHKKDQRPTAVVHIDANVEPKARSNLGNF